MVAPHCPEVAGTGRVAAVGLDPAVPAAAPNPAAPDPAAALPAPAPAVDAVGTPW